MSFRQRSMTVNGIEVTVDVDIDLQIGDLSGDMDKVASQMGFMANVWAAAVEEQINVDSHYRHWRAAEAQKIMEADAKLAEWKIKAAIESNPMFLKYKAAIARAESNVISSSKNFASLEKKSNILQSKGAMSRKELDATGMTTPATPRRRTQEGRLNEPKQSDHDPRLAAVKRNLKKKGEN